jgi:choline dehydrogenase-like flavoprotein
VEWRDRAGAAHLTRAGVVILCALAVGRPARVRESLIEAGAYDTITAPRIRRTGWHQLGTAKMGTDRLFCGGPVGPYARRAKPVRLRRRIWPTSGGMNPTATIAALALRCTERLIARRREQEVPR